VTAPKMSTSNPSNLIGPGDRRWSPAAQSPPETLISLPVTYDASGETSHDTAAAISSGPPGPPSAACLANSCACGVAISVSMTPGEPL
jgi:hypothetical protein